MNMGSKNHYLVLASSSRTRERILKNAGLTFIVDKPSLEESKVLKLLKIKGLSTPESALYLSTQKATQVSKRHPDVFIVGADQILEFEGHWYEKPTSLEMATQQLKSLSGKTHKLVSAVTVVKNEACLWSCTDEATLTMRYLSKKFIQNYIENNGDVLLSSVGAYQIEGVGIQLFCDIKGDFFTILGLPLLKLLVYLRSHGMIGI